MNNSNHSPSFAQIKHKALEDQRQALLEEYQAASDQLTYTLSAVDRLHLERQLRDFEQRIAETEVGLKSLAPSGGAPPPPTPLTPSQRNHLQQEHSELQQKYDSLTKSISALDVDISRALEEFRRQPLQDRRDEQAAERDQASARMAQIEAVLGMTAPDA